MLRIIQVKKWNYLILSQNPNITPEIVQSNPDKDWNYCGISKNNMSKSKELILLQSLYKTTMKDFPPEIVKDIASKIHPELREDVKNELLRRTRGARDRLKRLEEDDEDEPEDEFGRHFRSEYECMGCESGASNTFAHCRACREGRI